MSHAITLDTNPQFIARAEAGLAEVETAISEFQFAIQRGDSSIPSFSLHRLRAHANDLRSELDTFKRSFPN